MRYYDSNDAEPHAVYYQSPVNKNRVLIHIKKKIKQ